MRPLPPLWRWLAWAALADWLITRSLTRAAIHMPKPAWLIPGYEGLAWFGQFASTFAALLGFITLGWLVWHTRRSWGEAGLWGSLLAFNAASLLIAPAGLWAVLYHGLLLLILTLILTQAWRNASGWGMRLAATFTAVSLATGALYQLLPALYTAFGWLGPAPFTLELFNLGEASVTLTPFAFWLVARPPSIARRHFALALIPALAFTVAHLANPSMTAILSVWSTGLTLYLPWPLYALSLYAASATVLHALEHDFAFGWALLLVASGGYAPQLGSQIAFALLGMWLLTQPDPAPMREAPMRPTPKPTREISELASL